MTWLNEMQVEEAVDRFKDDPVLAAASRSLYNLVKVVNRNSDGWPYWQPPSKAAKRLMAILEAALRQVYRRDRDYVAPTAADVRKAYTPIKSFATRHKLTVELVDPDTPPIEIQKATLRHRRDELTGMIERLHDQRTRVDIELTQLAR